MMILLISHITLNNTIHSFKEQISLNCWQTIQIGLIYQFHQARISIISHLPNQISRNLHHQYPVLQWPSLPQIWESLFMILRLNCMRYGLQRSWRPQVRLTSFAPMMFHIPHFLWTAWCMRAVLGTVLMPSVNSLLVSSASNNRSTTSWTIAWGWQLNWMCWQVDENHYLVYPKAKFSLACIFMILGHWWGVCSHCRALQSYLLSKVKNDCYQKLNILIGFNSNKKLIRIIIFSFVSYFLIFTLSFSSFWNELLSAVFS